MDLGMDSVDAMLLKQRIRRALATSLQFDWANLETASLETLAIEMDQQDSAGASRLVVLERDRREPDSQLTLGGIHRCAAGDLAGLRALVERGEIGTGVGCAAPKWDPTHMVDKQHGTALMWASGNGHLAVVEYLLLHFPSIDPDAVNKQGRTALMQAAKNGEAAVMDVLVQHGADVLKLMQDRSSLLDWAVMGGHIAIVDKVLRYPGVDRHHRNSFGCSTIHWCAASGDVGMARHLHGLGFDFAAVNKARHSALDTAAQKGHRKLLEWLLEAADGPHIVQHLHLLDHQGRTLGELTRRGGHDRLADWLDGLRLRDSANNPH
jgi:hypothetical protein